MNATVTERVDVLYAALIPLEQGSALLPNSALLDVLPIALLEPLADTAPTADLAGFCGWVPHRGQRLPVLQFETLLGHDSAPPSVRGRLVVLQGLSSTEARVVLIAQAAPRRVTLSQQVLTADTAGADGDAFVAGRCRIARQPVIIPDLAALEQHGATLAARAEAV
ncbi:chemotaxis protein CheW [Polycyclovorans algicola]|uniref:chemotaxis protein CheW n=1 Tax=Polycyclovorans algicola TaxID=616992 RepID=UPI0004A6B6CC|nr:chemotaxis protein CheW [Polycyclovorans algicola]